MHMGRHHYGWKLESKVKGINSIAFLDITIEEQASKDLTWNLQLQAIVGNYAGKVPFKYTTQSTKINEVISNVGQIFWKSGHLNQI
jgi:hypothetical protein